MVKSRGYPLSPRANYSSSRFDERSLPSGSATIPHRAWDIMSTPIVTSSRGLGNPSQNHHKYSTHASPSHCRNLADTNRKGATWETIKRRVGEKKEVWRWKFIWWWKQLWTWQKCQAGVNWWFCCFSWKLVPLNNVSLKYYFHIFSDTCEHHRNAFHLKWKMQLEILISVDSQVVTYWKAQLNVGHKFLSRNVTAQKASKIVKRKHL